jgi:hypothetical protein
LIFVEEDYNSMEGSILYDEEGSILFYDRQLMPPTQKAARLISGVGQKGEDKDD